MNSPHYDPRYQCSAGCNGTAERPCSVVTSHAALHQAHRTKLWWDAFKAALQGSASAELYAEFPNDQIGIGDASDRILTRATVLATLAVEEYAKLEALAHNLPVAKPDEGRTLPEDAINNLVGAAKSVTYESDRPTRSGADFLVSRERFTALIKAVDAIRGRTL